MRQDLVQAAAALGVNLAELMASGTIPAGVTPEMVVLALQHRRRLELQQHQQQVLQQQQQAAQSGAASVPSGPGTGAPGTVAHAAPGAGVAEPAGGAQRKPHVLVLTPFPGVRGGKEQVHAVLQRLGWVVVDDSNPAAMATLTDVVVDPSVAGQAPFKAALDELRAKVAGLRVLDGCVLLQKLLMASEGQGGRAQKRPAGDNAMSSDAKRPSPAAVMQTQHPPLPHAVSDGALARGWRFHPARPSWSAADALADATSSTRSALASAALSTAASRAPRLALVGATMGPDEGRRSAVEAVLELAPVAGCLRAATRRGGRLARPAAHATGDGRSALGTPPRASAGAPGRGAMLRVPVRVGPVPGSDPSWAVLAAEEAPAGASEAVREAHAEVEAWCFKGAVRVRGKGSSAEALHETQQGTGAALCQLCGRPSEDDIEPWSGRAHLSCAVVRTRLRDMPAPAAGPGTALPAWMA